MNVDVLESPDLLRSAREDAGLTQSALAASMGIAQANLSAIESGKRPVSREMLVALLRAADYRPSLPLASHADEVKRIGEGYGVSNIRVFGSVAHGTDHSTSDIDLLVDVAPGRGYFAVGAFQADVESLLGFPVQVVVDSDQPHVVEYIRPQAVPL